MRIAEVKTQYSGFSYFFDAEDLDIKKGKYLVIETKRGQEIGKLVRDIYEVDETELDKDNIYQPVLREANSNDIEMFKQAQSKASKALPIFKRLAGEECPGMRPVVVEYLFNGDKAVFYFEAENRIDFRELIKKLRFEFHVKIEMHQIGVREEARMLGDYGSCGHKLCCKLMHGDLKPVSIKMAKSQDMSLNPEKISGTCGRLMCCLRYEEEAYKDFKSKAPKIKSKIDTPVGLAMVIGYEVPKGVVLVKPDDQEKIFRIPLKNMKIKNDGDQRLTLVTKAAWDDATKPNEIQIGIEGMISTSQFTENDEVGEAGSIRVRSGSSGKFSPSNADSPVKSGNNTNKSSGKKGKKKHNRSVSGGHKSTAVSHASGGKGQDLHKQNEHGKLRNKHAELGQETSVKRRRRSRSHKIETRSQRPGQNSSELRK